MCTQVKPRLPPGLDLMLVDDYSAQIVGVPQTESPTVDYTIMACNRIGRSSTHIRYDICCPRLACSQVCAPVVQGGTGIAAVGQVSVRELMRGCMAA